MSVGSCRSQSEAVGVFFVVVDGHAVFVCFLQSTINPVDGIYQPSLDTPVVNTTMPTQTTLPTGTGHLPAYSLPRIHKD